MPLSSIAPIPKPKPDLGLQWGIQIIEQIAAVAQIPRRQTLEVGRHGRQAWIQRGKENAYDGDLGGGDGRGLGYHHCLCGNNGRGQWGVLRMEQR